MVSWVSCDLSSEKSLFSNGTSTDITHHPLLANQDIVISACFHDITSPYLFAKENKEQRAAMNPRGISRAIHRIAFSDCRNGLGIEIIGGYQEQSEEDWGIFVKKILPCGMAAIDSRLLVGDLILEVNGENLVGVTNKRALEILQMASVTNHMSLLIARDEEAK
ncbi:UNVERIFIED_CONTAM: hypothetical protein K2H54_035601 [Gekko kuhli]